MIIKTKLTEKDLINVNFILLYSKLSVKIFTGIGILMLFVATVSFFSQSRHSSLTTIIAPVFILIGFPLLTYFGSKRSFTTNKRISETIEYQFGKDLLFIKGESFTAQLTWDKIYKVSKTKNWILIWQNKQVANVISRRDIWEGDITELKEILQTHKVKNNL